ncbi:MAG: hypothetical protein RMM98_12475 [Acidobacteriota bacterium]|nr:hypothetical protein [Blastocatellia bacterium]MDW8240425.1 hypothetical protein [Acidobacteriota bacterium]
MMDCETLQREFDPAAPITAAMQRHLRDCQSCQCYVRELTQLRALLRTYPPVAVPHDFNLRLQQRVERLGRHPLAWWRWADIRYALPIAAMLLLGVGTLALLNERTSSPEVSRAPMQTVTPRPTDMASDSDVNGEPPSFHAVGVWSGAAALPPSPSESAGRELVSSRTVRAGRQSRFAEGSQILLRLRDDRREREKLLAIPSVVVGAEPLFVSTRTTTSESDHVY